MVLKGLLIITIGEIAEKLNWYIFTISTYSRYHSMILYYASFSPGVLLCNPTSPYPAKCDYY